MTIDLDAYWRVPDAEMSEDEWAALRAWAFAQSARRFAVEMTFTGLTLTGAQC